MAQKSLNQQFPIDRRTRIDDAWLRRLLGVLESRLSGIETKAADFDSAVAELLSIGIDRINEVLIPAIEQVRDLTQLGFLIAGSQTPALLVEDATTIFTVPAGAQRDLFTPSAFVILTRDATLDDWAILRTVSYNRENGEYVGTMVAVHGGPGPFSDWTLGALAGSTIAQMEMLDESEILRDQVAQLKADTNTLKGETGAIRNEVILALDSTILEKEAVEDMRDEVEADRAEVATKKADFDRAYWGRRATPPPTTGEGAAQPGALYVDTSVTPNVVKVLGAGGTWAPAVTVSIGGARQQIYIATEGQTGPFSVDGGFTTGSVNVNGAELYHGHGVTLSPGPAGSFTLDQPRKAGDLVVFSGYLANDATDIFTKAESDTRFLRKDGAQVLSAVERGVVFANAGGSHENDDLIINGCFDHAQRAGSQSGNGYGSLDRWALTGTGGTITQERVPFTLGDTLGSNVKPFMGRMGISGQSLASHAAIRVQPIEDVRSYAGQTITVLGWARRISGAGDIAIEGLQFFGTGGSPSATVTGISPKKVPLSGVWAPFAVTLEVPPVAGKTIGTNGNHYFGLNFWMSAGADHAARVDGLGIQTIQIDLFGVHIRKGVVPVEAVNFFSPRHIQQELALCQRYYEVTICNGYDTDRSPNALVALQNSFKVVKRAVPTLSLSATFLNGSIRTGVIEQPSQTGWIGYGVCTGGGLFEIAGTVSADAEL